MTHAIASTRGPARPDRASRGGWSMSLGPVMLDVAGTELTAEDRELLLHPAVGGVILFSRNFSSPDQLARLTSSIHGLREPRLLIAADQEGGRVQRFREGFARLPPAGRFGALHARDPEAARAACSAVAWLMAAELRAVGVDFSFAPVLDLDRAISTVIGDRGFSAEPAAVADLACAWADGAARAGMASVGKHFPGHGGVGADSHRELPRDERDLDALLAEDLVPFARLIERGLPAMMPAHVVYPRIAPEPAGFSPFWLQEVLRGRLGFRGAIFSDDLSMAAAGAGGGPAERALAAARAGCDMLLVCNDRRAAIEVVEVLGGPADPAAESRLLGMQGRADPDPERLASDPRRQEALRQLALLVETASPGPMLGDPTA